MKGHAWLQELRGVQQDPEFHAEGDVLQHTRLVVEQLVALPAWRELAEADRHVLFAAALLHDMGKPARTRIEDDGSIHSRKHARWGEVRARKILWSGTSSATVPAFATREAICQLVREHGLPLWVMEKPDAVRRVVRASLRIPLHWLALLAEADMRGRVCRDQADLLARIDLFRELAQELQCYDRPRAFPSPHSRFVYFHSQSPNLDYSAHDPTDFEVALMSGLPGAGKDTWIRQELPHLPVVSLDAIRRARKISPQDDQGRVVQAAREHAREFLRAKTPFVWSATNLTYRLRSSLVNLFAGYDARIRIVYVEAPLEVIFERNRARPHKVPDAVMERMLESLEIPGPDEAHAVNWLT